MNHCIMCHSPLQGDEKPEHILLKALGGRETTKNALCDQCNSDFGSGPDEEFALSLEPLRNLGNFKKGDGRSPPTIRKIEVDDVRFDLKPGGIPILNPVTPMKNKPDGSISIEARDEDHARQLLRSAACKLGIPIEQHEKYVEQAMQDVHRHVRAAPSLQYKLELGLIGARRSMIKACLVLWNEVVGNSELSSNRYDTARLFSNGKESVAPLVEMDVRPLPISDNNYGTNPNLIWVGSDSQGRVLGYFRIFGAIGWCFELCCSGAPTNLHCCLVSDPYKTKNRGCGEDLLPEISFEWVNAASMQDLGNVQLSLSHILSHARSNAIKREMGAIFEEVCQDMGINDDEAPLTLEESTALTMEFTKRFLSFIEDYKKTQNSDA